MFVVIGLRVFGKTADSMSPTQVSVWDCINPKYWSIFEIPSIPNQSKMIQQIRLRLKLRSKLTGFEIEVGLTELRPNACFFNWQLTIVQIEINFSGDHLKNKRQNFSCYITHILICKKNPQTKCGFHLHFADSPYSLWIPLNLIKHVLLFV